MALFKIFMGSDTNKLKNPAQVPYVEGYAYYNTSNQEFYIDAKYDGINVSRKPINANYAYSAGYDGASTPQRIDSTYIKDITISNNGLAYTTGNSQSHDINSTFSDDGKFLNHAGTWDNILSSDIQPMQSKTFTDVIGTANSWAGATFFFGSIKPTSWYTSWRIKYKIRTYVPGKNGYDQIADVILSGDQGSLRSYSSFNTVGPSYPAYYHVLYRLKNAGFTNGYGHSVGVRFYSAYSPIDTNYKRTIVIDIYETENCTFSFYDNCLVYSSIPGTGSTNYDTYSEINYCSNGLQETGDNNDANYQNRIYYTSSTAAEAIYRYQLLLRTRNQQLLPVSSANNTFTIGKTYSTTPFDPFGGIYYYNSTSNVAINGNLGNSILYRQILADLRYAFDLNASVDYKLIARKPIYLTATPQADGTAILTKPTNSTIGPLSQTLPTTEDGLIYIYLGQAYEDTYPYRLELALQHPIYWYKNGAIRLYEEINRGIKNITRSGTTFTVTRDDNSTFTFTQQDNNTWNALSTSQAGYVAQAPNDTAKFLRGDATWAAVTKTNVGLGNVTNHQQVHEVTWDSTNKKITRSKNGTAGDVVQFVAGSNITLTGEAGKLTIASNYVDTKVTQSNNTTNADYRILLSGNANDTSETTTSNKSTNLRFNPSTKLLSIGGNISTTGNLTVTGNAYLNNETYTNSLTTDSLIVQGNTNFVQSPTAPTPGSSSNDTTIATTAFVKTAINNLDVSSISGVGAGKTLASLSETDGKISATFQNISITKSQISDFPTTMTPTSHTHGNLSNDGKITSTATIATGDKLVIVDSDITAANKITSASITFDTSKTGYALTQAGTWAAFNNYSHPTTTAVNTAAVKVGKDNLGHVIIGNALTAADVGVSATTTSVTVGSTTFNKYTHPTTSGNKHIPSGGLSGQFLGYASDGTAQWVDNPIAVNDALIYKGTLDGSASIVNGGNYTPAANCGWTYKVATAGYINGQEVQVGDTFICLTDNTSAATSSNYSTIQENWNILQTNDGVVIGPVSSTADHIATFTGVTGKIIKDSGKSLSDYKPKQTAYTDSTGTSESTTATRFVYSVSQDANGVVSFKTRPLPTYNNYSLPTASTSTKGGIKVGTGLTMNGEVMNHSNSVTAKSNYVDTATTASANGGTIKVTDIKYDAQGHITGSQDRTITLSQTTYTLSGLGGVGSVNASGTAPLTLSATKSGTTVTLTGSIAAATTSAAGTMSAADKTKLDGITESADSVSFTRSLTSGTKIGTITINGTGTDLYCQTNTDTKVTQTVKTDNAEYPLLTKATTATSTVTDTSNFVAGVTLNPSTKTITATNFAGNASTASKLKTVHSINGTSFDGSADITTTNWGTARNISISDNDGTNTSIAVSVDGSGAVTLKLPATIKANITGNISGSSGSCTGNAATATEFSSNATVKLTGDVTGEASAKKGWTVATTLANSGVTANTYGNTSQQTPSHGSTFNIPYFTVDAKGRVTSAGTTTVKLPSDNNTDTLVKQTVKTDNVEYKILTTTFASPTSGDAAEAAYSTDITINPSAKAITSPNYNVTSNATITYNTANGCLEIIVA